MTCPYKTKEYFITILYFVKNILYVIAKYEINYWRNIFLGEDGINKRKNIIFVPLFVPKPNGWKAGDRHI